MQHGSKSKALVPTLLALQVSIAWLPAQDPVTVTTGGGSAFLSAKAIAGGKSGTDLTNFTSLKYQQRAFVSLNQSTPYSNGIAGIYAQQQDSPGQSIVSVFGSAYLMYYQFYPYSSDNATASHSMTIRLLAAIDREVQMETTFAWSETVKGTGAASLFAGSYVKPGKTIAKISLRKGIPAVVPVSGSFRVTPPTNQRTTFGLSYSANIKLTWNPSEVGLVKLGIACGGNFETITAPEIGKTMTVALQNGTPNGTAIVYVGDGQDQFGPFKLPLDLQPFCAPGCNIYINALVGFGQAINASGGARASFLVPTILRTNFSEFRLQWAFLTTKNALGLHFTDARRSVWLK